MKLLAPSGPAHNHLVSAQEMEMIYRLWDGLDGIPSTETDRALRYLSEGLAHLLGADNVKWLAAVRIMSGRHAKTDAMHGWRLRASHDLVPVPEKYRKVVAPLFQHKADLDPDFLIGEATLSLIAGVGKFRVHRLRDGWISYRKFSRSEHYRINYTALGLTDRMWVSIPLNADTESVFLIDRTRARRFQKKDAFLAGLALRALPGFQRRLFLARGLLIAERPLSPTQQRIVEKLLSGRTEKEIAAAMGQSVTTTHGHVMAIYGLYGVKSRAALMSLWLGS